MTSDANSGRRGLWIEAKYPGDAVRTLMLKRGDELGQVCIQQYETYLKVGLFVPGIGEKHVWPEKHRDVIVSDDADACFDNYVQEAYAMGWQNYEPEDHHAA